MAKDCPTPREGIHESTEVVENPTPVGSTMLSAECANQDLAIESGSMVKHDRESFSSTRSKTFRNVVDEIETIRHSRQHLAGGPLADADIDSTRSLFWPIKETDEGRCRVLSHENASLPLVSVRGKRLEICSQSLYAFSVHSSFRQRVLELVEWRFFDKFILTLILLNSVMLAVYQYRDKEAVINKIVDDIADPIFTVFFLLECVLKIIGWGLIFDKNSYLRDAWNWLDITVVVTAIISWAMDGGKISTLRVFRVLRPLKSLQVLPELKNLVRALLGSMPKLVDVSLMGIFLFNIFGIVGISLWDGVFYRQCRTTPAPVLSTSGNCWEWLPTGEERLCGGRYECAPGGFCGGHPQDVIKKYRPTFPQDCGDRGLPWCPSNGRSKTSPLEHPPKLFPENDFIHFDHIGGAFLIVFQSMTMEGWVDILYSLQDSAGTTFPTIFFICLIFVESFFLLNIFLAVVAESWDNIEREKDDQSRKTDTAQDPSASLAVSEQPSCSASQATGFASEGVSSGALQASFQQLARTSSSVKFGMGGSTQDEEPVWIDHWIIHRAHEVVTGEIFTNFIMFFIAANVVTMCMEKFRPELQYVEFLSVSEIVLVSIFALEMVLMLAAMGPKQYFTNPLTCFDGSIVILSIVEMAFVDGSALRAFRGFRLVRVIFKIANKWGSFRVLLKAMVKTVISLGYFAVLFALVVYIFTLLFLNLFATKFHFTDDSHAEVLEPLDTSWCIGPGFGKPGEKNEDCIPRAHFDTFVWAFVTIFQMMSGENWNTVMYDGMRAGGWPSVVYFVFVVIFGQIMILNLFLTILMAKFQEENRLQEEARIKEASRKSRRSRKSSGIRKKASLFKDFKARMNKINDVEGVEESTKDGTCMADSSNFEYAKFELEAALTPENRIVGRQEDEDTSVLLPDTVSDPSTPHGSPPVMQRTPLLPGTMSECGASSQGASVTHLRDLASASDTAAISFAGMATVSESIYDVRTSESVSIASASIQPKVVPCASDTLHLADSMQFPRTVSSNAPDIFATAAMGSGSESICNVREPESVSNARVDTTEARTSSQTLGLTRTLYLSEEPQSRVPENRKQLLETSSIPVGRSQIAEQTPDLAEQGKSPREARPKSALARQSSMRAKGIANRTVKISPAPEEQEENVDDSQRQTEDSRRAWPTTSMPATLKTAQTMEILQCWSKVGSSPRNETNESEGSDSPGSDSTTRQKTTAAGEAAPLLSSQPSQTSSLSIKTDVLDPESEVSSAEWPVSWPWGYSFFVFGRQNPLRQFCRTIVMHKVKSKKEAMHEATMVRHGTIVRESVFSEAPIIHVHRFRPSKFVDAEGNLRFGEVFDNLILTCILISSVCMAVDSPLSDPNDTLTKITRGADGVFVYIFLLEMVMKLIALGLAFGPEAYLKSAWNWLDGIVVIISIVGSSVSFLMSMRILKALRPLRVISRNENLKVVVNTIFASLPDLATLGALSVVFLLVIGLFCVSWLKGSFYHCVGDAGPFAVSSPRFVTPLCLGSSAESACPGGLYNASTKSWHSSDCSQCTASSQSWTQWQRPSVDTPICIGRCNPSARSDQGFPPQEICPSSLSSADQFPSVCPAGELNLDPSAAANGDELIGINYVQMMLKKRVMPCFGPDPNGVGGCRSLFCPEEISSEKKDSCKADCWKDPYLCHDTCEGWRDNSTRDGVKMTSTCGQCLQECEASCQCSDFCEPLVRDAATCVEQGGAWRPTMKQNFNTVFNSMLTLFEISTTEMWVDVMYSAVDHNDPYLQPRRDLNLHWTLFFILYIFLANMFILNLCVGVIVNNFLQIRESTGGIAGITDRQKAWIDSMTDLHKRKLFFPLRNLHLQPPLRVKAHRFIERRLFDELIMVAILLNTLAMMLKMFPAPYDWWDSAVDNVNHSFALIFLFEFILKYYAHRGNYWRDSWNVFDALVLMSTIAGFIADILTGDDESGALGSVVLFAMRIFRLFRILRVFRIIRFLKGLNTIFTALLLSLPRLVNVFILLMLMLVLYSILGVQLFAKVKFNDALNEHGNFRNFFWAALTLFRSLTGESWNEIMHDLSMDEIDLLNAGDWCSPPELFDETEKFDVLNAKCLIDHPNSCGKQFLYEGVLFFVTYTLLVTFIVMNVLIAVILDGYLEGGNKEKEVIDVCIHLWKKHDPDYTMLLPLETAFTFIEEVMARMKHEIGMEMEEEGIFNPKVVKKVGSKTFNSIPMQNAKILEKLQMNEREEVPFLQVVDLVLLVVCTRNKPDALQDVEGYEATLQKEDPRTLMRLKRYQEKQIARNGITTHPEFNLRAQIAATKIQHLFKARKLRKAMTLDDIAEGSRTAASIALRASQRSQPCTPGAAGALTHSCTTALETLSPYQLRELAVATQSPESVRLLAEQTEATVSGRQATPPSSEGNFAVSPEPMQEEAVEHLVPRSGAACDGLDEPGNSGRIQTLRHKIPEGTEPEARTLANNKGSSSLPETQALAKPAQENTEEPPREAMVPAVAG